MLNRRRTADGRRGRGLRSPLATTSRPASRSNGTSHSQDGSLPSAMRALMTTTTGTGGRTQHVEDLQPAGRVLGQQQAGFSGAHLERWRTGPPPRQTSAMAVAAASGRRRAGRDRQGHSGVGPVGSSGQGEAAAGVPTVRSNDRRRASSRTSSGGRRKSQLSHAHAPSVPEADPAAASGTAGRVQRPRLARPLPNARRASPAPPRRRAGHRRWPPRWRPRPPRRTCDARRPPAGGPRCCDRAGPG